MTLSAQHRKHYRAIGHHLKPVLTLAEQGLTPGVEAELHRALQDHELIKVQLRIADREERQQLIQALVQAGQCELVQSIGKVVLLYRNNPQPNRQLSNICRHSNEI